MESPSIAAVEQAFDKDNFKKGTHWLFRRGDGDTLFVAFSVAMKQPGHFDHFRALEKFRGNDLFLGDPDNLFYQTSIDHIQALVQGLQRAGNFRRIVYWGGSMGAYATLLFSAIGPPVPSDAYAFAPILNLNLENTAASVWVGAKREKLDARYTDLVPLLRRNHCRRYGLVPCYEWADGAQVRDMRLIDPDAHRLQVAGTSHRVFEDIIATSGRHVYEDYLQRAHEGRDIVVPSQCIPSLDDQRRSVDAYHCMEFVAGRAACPDLDVDDKRTQNHGWLVAKSAALGKRGDVADAVVAGMRSIALRPDDLGYVVCLANVLEQSKQPVARCMAEGLYRHIARERPHLRTMLDRQLEVRGLQN